MNYICIPPKIVYGNSDSAMIRVRKTPPSPSILPTEIYPKPSPLLVGSSLNFVPVLPSNTHPKHYILHPICLSEIFERRHNIQIVILFYILIVIMYEKNYHICIISFIIHTAVIMKRYKTK